MFAHQSRCLKAWGSLRRTIIGNAERKLTIGDAALTGIVWAFSLDEAGSLLQLHCPPIILRWLAGKFLDNCGNAAKEDIYLARNIYETIPYPFNSGLQGEAFEHLSLIAEVCRQSLLAEGKCKVCRRLRALLRSTLKILAPSCLAEQVDRQNACCRVAFCSGHAILGKKAQMAVGC